jgi:hypothetical protein
MLADACPPPSHHWRLRSFDLTMMISFSPSNLTPASDDEWLSRSSQSSQSNQSTQSTHRARPFKDPWVRLLYCSGTRKDQTPEAHHFQLYGGLSQPNRALAVSITALKYPSWAKMMGLLAKLGSTGIPDHISAAGRLNAGHPRPFSKFEINSLLKPESA